MATSPPDDLLRDALKDLRDKNPTLGTSKLHALLLGQHTEWSVSEKRVKKILTAENLILTPTPGKNVKNIEKHDKNREILHPRSRVIDDLDINRFTKMVKVVDFGPSKGKGLVAVEDIKEGQDIWKEDPFAISPEWYVFVLSRLNLQ